MASFRLVRDEYSVSREIGTIRTIISQWYHFIFVRDESFLLGCLANMKDHILPTKNKKSHPLIKVSIHAYIKLGKSSCSGQSSCYPAWFAASIIVKLN